MGGIDFLKPFDKYLCEIKTESPQNGAGKSTLRSAVAGRRLLDEGKALVKPGVSVGYLVQTAVQGSNRTVYPFVYRQVFEVPQILLF